MLARSLARLGRHLETKTRYAKGGKGIGRCPLLSLERDRAFGSLIPVAPGY